MSSLTMADLLANQSKSLSIERGQEVEGQVVAILDNEIVLDLGTKAEGILPKKDLSADQLSKLKLGDKLNSYVFMVENESGQVILGAHKSLGKGKTQSPKWDKFQKAQKTSQIFRGKGLELNKGGLIVEVEGIRGFLPSSQVTLSQAANLEELIGKDINVTIIEVEPNQNRLILSQKTQVTAEVKSQLNKMKVGDKAQGVVAAVLPFGVFVTLPEGVEGLVHISEVSWDKVEEVSSLFKVGDPVSSQVISVDESTGRVNLSIKQLSQDPFTQKASQFKPSDVVKATVTKSTSQGLFLKIVDGVEGFMATNKQDTETDYPIGKELTCLIDSVDTQRRRVNLVPFITSTKDLIYK